MKFLEESIDIDGQKLTLQFGKLAKAATTSVFATLGETSILVAVTAGKVRDDLDYFPLQVEYIERLYAGGIIKGSRWVKREGRPSDEAVLKGCLIDRSIRPLFPKTYKRDVQIIITLLSFDAENDPEILASIATSAALHVSPIPWKGPVSTLRMGYIPENGEEKGAYIVNPNDSEKKHSLLDLVATTSKDKVLMIETEAQQLDEAIFEKALVEIKKTNAQIIDFIESLREKIGMPKEEANDPIVNEEIAKMVKDDYAKEIDAIVAEIASKESGRSALLDELVTTVAEKIGEEADKKEIAKVIDYVSKQQIRNKTLDEKIRVDGRKPDEIRPLSADVSLLKRTHGTGIFQRGDTQVLSIATLGGPSLGQLIESPEGQEEKRYIHHYNFPPYSVGETGRIGFTSRREIGHGALAEKAIEPVLPTENEFPYTIRVVSEVLTSNGSTSMASTCGSSLALMDAGVPIKAAVGGIAMGIMSRSDSEYVILTDIMGIEDFCGEMDFKVTGTTKGITAVQLDVKNAGLTDEMVAETMAGAKKARAKVLDVMNKVISEPRKTVSDFAPKVRVIMIPTEKIGEVIGPGGKMIRSLITQTETDINIDEDGSVTITGIKIENVERAAAMITNMTREIEVGEEFTGPVKRLLPFGAFVEISPGKEGLVHVSKMGTGFVRNPADVVQIGDVVKVKVYQIDNQGRINLQMIEAPKQK